MSKVINTIGGGSGGGISAWETVWTNQNDSQSFSAQTVPLDLSSYSEFLILFRVYSTNANAYFQQAIYFKNYAVVALTQYGGKFTRRTATISDTGVAFLEGGQDNSYGASSLTVNNAYMIPSVIKAR